MNKKILYALTSLALVCSLSSCGDKKGKEEQKEPEIPALFELTKQSVTLDLFSNYQIETVDEIDGSMLYTSDNEAVASVDINGVVHTHNIEGQANISVTYGYSTQVLKVTALAESNINFEFEYQNVNVELYQTLRIPYKVTYLGKDVTDEVDVSYSVDDEKYLDLVDVYGKNSLGVFAKEVGQTQITLYSVISDVYYCDVVNVNIVRPDYVVYSPLFSGDVGSYSCDIYIYSNSSNHVTSVDLNTVKVYYAGLEIPGVEISMSIDDETIARIDDQNKLVPVKNGSTVLRLAYQENIYIVNINVKKEVFELDLSPVLNKNNPVNEIYLNGKTIYGTPNDLIIDSCGTSIFGSYNSGMKLINVNVDKIPLNVKYLQSQKLTLETDLATYKLNSTIYSAIIRNKSDLKGLATTCFVEQGKYDGYVLMMADVAWDSNEAIFANNITYTGSENAYTGFNGVFDGNGYTISGFNSSRGYKGLFGNCLSNSSVIKNLSITGVSLGSGKTSVISTKGFGVLENVYIQIDSVNSGANGGALYSCWDGSAHPNNKGVFIDYGETPIHAVQDNGGVKGFIPTTFQDAGVQTYCVVCGTYSTSGVNGVYYETYKALNKDLAKIREFFIYPYWNNDTSLSFAHYHPITTL